MQKNSLVRKIKSNLWRQVLGNIQLQYTYCPISQVVKKRVNAICGQLMKYNMINIFLEISYTKYGGKNIPRRFYEKSKLSISLAQSS